MSGIVGIVHAGGRPIEPALLHALTESLAFRGPDAQEVWAEGPAGLGHALLRTDESTSDRQPCTLDGQVWLTADARIDGRADLVRRLREAGRTVAAEATDAELILHAYHAWGEACVEQLLGDFAFALWDGPRRRLFCARDHFGVKPFYYARSGDGLVFSNTLDCVRCHPDVTSALNEQALGDFLLFGFNQELTSTSFADVQRLPPAHALTWADGELRLRRYWSLPTDRRLTYRRQSDYVEHFREVLRTAVADRLRTQRVGVFMSGGLDSTTVAAVARDLLAQGPRPFDLRAYTLVYDRLIPDEERHYSGLAAAALGLPIHYLPADDYLPFVGWQQRGWRTPEPTDEPLALGFLDQLEQVRAHSRVALTGQGGDAVFFPAPLYLVELLGQFRWGRWLAEVGSYLLSHGKLPPLGLRNWWVRRRNRLHEAFPYPDWLDEAFARRLGLRQRWQELTRQPAEVHPTHGAAAWRLLAPYWTNLLEGLDPGVTRCPVELRHPLFDLRLSDFVFAIPPMPWCVDKELLRSAMRGILPESVRRRPKTLLAGDPLGVILRLGSGRWLQRDMLAHVGAYVDRQRVLADLESYPRAGTHDSYLAVRPLCLDHWLRSLSINVLFHRSEKHHAAAAVQGGVGEETLPPPRAHRVRSPARADPE
jgi:asparagine synthase (glutamine-hydrolysing)